MSRRGEKRASRRGKMGDLEAFYKDVPSESGARRQGLSVRVSEEGVITHLSRLGDRGTMKLSWDVWYELVAWVNYQRAKNRWGR
jgi:hypothetical protein